MLATLKRHAQDFLALPPGERFISTFERGQARRRGPLRRIAFLAAGIGLILVGLFALVAPGPGLLLVVGGFLLLARESRHLARALDRLELWGRRRWERSPLAQRLERWWKRRRARRAAGS